MRRHLILLTTVLLFPPYAHCEQGAKGRAPVEIERAKELTRERQQQERLGMSDAEYRRFQESLAKEFGITSPYGVPTKGPRVAQPSKILSGPGFGQNSLRKPLQLPRAFVDPIERGQGELIKLKYYDGNPDGHVGPKTQAALAKFQADHNLKVTRSFDSATLNALGVSSVPRFSFRPPRNFAATIENMVPNLYSRYRVKDSTGRVLFACDDPEELTAHFNDELKKAEHGSLYVGLKGFSEDKAEALASSLRIQQKQSSDSVAIRVIPDITVDPELDRHLFEPGIVLEKADYPIETITSGNYRGWLETKLDVKTRAGRAVLRLMSAVRSIVEDCGALVRRRFGPEGNESGQSLAKVIEGARKDLKANHPEFTDDQLRIEIIYQFGHTRIVRLRTETFGAAS